MLERGTVVAGYRIDSVLGAGGMGIVYEATQLSLDRTVALKLLSSEFGADESFRRRFRREGRIQAGLDHPNIVTVHEAGETEHGLFLAMRLVRGGTLKDMIVARELDVGRALRILRPVADALDAAHEAGLIHRDVKPQNILVGGRDHPYLADFGLTQPAGGSHVTATGQFVGTFDYISPEQIQGEEPSPAVDVYALAAVLYECLTGQVPFAHRSRAAVVYAHMAQEPPRVTDQRPELPQALDAAVARGMAKQPADRPRTALALIEQAERAFDRRSRAALQPPGPVESAEEVGVRGPESSVSTAEAARPGPLRTSTPATIELPAAPPSPAPVRRPRRVRWPAAAATVAAAAAVAVLGVAIGSAGGHAPKPVTTAPNTASVGPLEIGYGGALRRTDSGPRIPGLPAGAIRLTGDAGGMAAAVTTATGRTLLPRALQQAVRGRLPRPAHVRTAQIAALRYAGLRLSGIGQPVTIYAAPTSAGVATVACYGSDRFVPLCSRVVSSATLHGARALPLSPSRAYAASLTRVIRVLAIRRAAARTRLAHARTPAGQASAATAASAGYYDAAGSVGSLTAGPAELDDNRSIASALRAAGDSYEALAAAARGGRRRAYAHAASTVRRREAHFDRALRHLHAAGYAIQ